MKHILLCCAVHASLLAQSSLPAAPQLLRKIDIDEKFRIVESADTIYLWKPDALMAFNMTSAAPVPSNPKIKKLYVQDLKVSGNSVYILANKAVYKFGDAASGDQKLLLPSFFSATKLGVANGHVWVAGSRTGKRLHLDDFPNSALDESGHGIYASVIEARSGRWLAANLWDEAGRVLDLETCGTTLVVGTRWGVYPSTDAGKNWDGVPDPDEGPERDDNFPTGIACLDKTHLWVSYSEGSIIRRQGGKKWEIVKTKPHGSVFQKMTFLTPQKGVGLDEDNGSLWLTEDGGKTWTNIFPGSEDDDSKRAYDFALNPGGWVDFITASTLQRIKM